eukprot:6178605-Karenia_brevis.AAC.1
MLLRARKKIAWRTLACNHFVRVASSSMTGSLPLISIACMRPMLRKAMRWAAQGASFVDGRQP